jgi:hypothetical protein
MEDQNLASLEVTPLKRLVWYLPSSCILKLYTCGQQSFNMTLSKRVVTELSLRARKSDGKDPFLLSKFDQLTTLSISFGDDYADLHRIDQLDLSLLPSTLTSFSLCCANAIDFFEEIENCVQIREEGLEGGLSVPKSAYRSMLPNLKEVFISTRSDTKSLAKRVPYKNLPDANLVVVYSSFPIIGEHLTKFKTTHWEQSFLGLLPDCIEELEFEVGLVVKSFTAFNIMPRSLKSLKGINIVDHSLGWEVDFDAIYETIVRRSPTNRFVSKLQSLEATTEVFYKV